MSLFVNVPLPEYQAETDRMLEFIAARVIDEANSTGNADLLNVSISIEELRAEYEEKRTKEESL